MESAKSFFDVWFEGVTDSMLYEKLGMNVKHGFSKEICIPKANKPKEE